MKVLHLLASNVYSGAENVVCQIIDMFNGEIEMAYCSPNGKIAEALEEKNIKFFPLNKLNKQEVVKIVEEYNPDIIHAHDVRASVVASKFNKKAKIISHVHGNDKRKMGKPSLKSIRYALSFNKYFHIFWVSKSCYDDYIFKGLAKNKSSVLYNIINIDKLKHKVDQDNTDYNNDIIYLGRLSEIKNPLRALEIMREVIDKRPETRCAMVGTGELYEECRTFVKNNNLDNNVTMYGFQSNPYKLLKSSKVILMSSINEGTPMVLLEAFALGVPLVSSKVDGAVEIIKNDSMGALYNDNEQAVESVLKILKDDTNQRKKYLEKFSEEYNDIKAYKDKILNVYRN